MKVSVIIPIYKVETYIKRCAESLFCQTMQEDVEFIFVDDCSPDDSVFVLNEVLEKYPQRRAQVTILRHEDNRGLPTARNTGLIKARGEYIFHCDSDDWMETTALQHLYDKAMEQDADFVWCDWYLAFTNNRRYMKQPNYDTAQEALLATLGGAMKYNVWNKFVRRSLYEKNGICFPEGHAMGEDMTMIRLLTCAKRVSYVPFALYNYAKHEGEALTNRWNKKSVEDLLFNTELTVDFIAQYPFDKWEEKVAWFQLNVKYSFLISKDNKLYVLWKRCFANANGYIWSNPYISMRSKILQQVAFCGQFWIVRLHYILIYRFIYGVVYK